MKICEIINSPSHDPTKSQLNASLMNALLVCSRLLIRAEKEKSQYWGELTDLKSSVDHIANEKVHYTFQDYTLKS